MDDVAADISGNLFNLPAGPVKVALAGEMRWLGYLDQFRCLADRGGQLLRAFAFAATPPEPAPSIRPPSPRPCGTTTPCRPSTANENVWEFSGEVGIPILKDLPLVQSLDADLAGRYTNYSISGAVETWKIGLDWHVNDDVRFRGTTSVDIRAPTLNDLYSPQASNSGPFLDPLTNFNPGGIQTMSAGQPQPACRKSSRTYTGGRGPDAELHSRPDGVGGLLQIKLKNAIGTVSGSNSAVANLCIASGGSSPFCALYVRPFPYTNTTPANYPTLLLSESLNAAFNETEGEDYEIDYGFDTADIDPSLAGLVNLRALLNVAPVLNTSQFPGRCATFAPYTTPSQKGHATLFGDYTLGNWSVDCPVALVQ